MNSNMTGSLLPRTADRTPKTLALQRDPSRSIFTPSFKRSPYIVSPRRPWRHMESSSTFKRISSPTRDIKKIPAPLRSHISLPVARFVPKFVAKVRGPDVAAARRPILTPVKLSSQPYD
ncbi:hypothetical protein AVEN_203077-1 [Araneus ventricosus]|uniref:Uncharacterized protein n=2 Tax=Araneus ventricosus TaxID=182803 RepID=A0A4Y2QE94_ARAVE|nr:hypothetical protein AVEN_203077-1 [Araneus ventricosus]